MQPEKKVWIYNRDQNQLLGCLTHNKRELLLLAFFFFIKKNKEFKMSLKLKEKVYQEFVFSDDT